eukprot:261446_1
MAAIETADEIMDKLRLNIAQLGIATIRKLQTTFEAQDANQTEQVSNEVFMSSLMKNALYLSKIDLSNIIRYFKSNELNVNYGKFMNELSPPLAAQREDIVKQLFDLIKESTQQTENIILYRDLISLCRFKNHPSVQSGQFSANYARDIIKTAFDSIQNDQDQITYTKFKYYFRGISSGYPYNTNAFIRFVQSCWCDMFENVNNGNFSVQEAEKYVEQIEAMLAEKTRQKVRGSENESKTLLRQFKHFDCASKGYMNYAQFVRALEGFGVMAPEKELTMMFGKWSDDEVDERGDSLKKLYYREFVQQLFKKY